MRVMLADEIFGQSGSNGPKRSKTRSSNKQIDHPQNCVYQLFWDPLQRINNKTTYIEFFAKMTPTYPNTSLCLQCLPRQPWRFIFSYQSFVIMVHIFLSKLTTRFLRTHLAYNCDHGSYFLIKADDYVCSDTYNRIIIATMSENENDAEPDDKHK